MIHPLSYSHSLNFSRQACQLGQHRPICKSHPEGILKVGTTEGRSMTEQPITDWFLKMAARDGNNEAFKKLKLFAQVCRYDLGIIFILVIKTKCLWDQIIIQQILFFFFFFFLPSLAYLAPYLSEQTLDSSLLSQRSQTVAASSSLTSSSSSSSSSTSSGPQGANTSSAAQPAQPAQINSTPPTSSSGSQMIGGMASAKPSSYSPFGTTGLQGSTSQNGPQSTPQSSGGPAENGPSASQPQGPTEVPERYVTSPGVG